MSDLSFYSARNDWLMAVVRDSRLPPQAARVAAEIANHARPESPEPYPSQERLAEALGLEPRTIRRLVASLVDTGHLHVSAGRGRGNVNRYRLTPRDAQANIRPEKGMSETGFTSTKEDTGDRFTENKTGQTTPEKEDASVLQKLNIETKYSLRTKPAVSPADPKAILWGQGLATICRLTGKQPGQARALLGKWRGIAKNDDAALMGVIEAAEAEGPAEPISWIMARLGPLAAFADPAVATAFEKFRAAYPKGSGQNWVEARKAFARAVAAGADPSQIVACVKRFARAMRQESRPVDKIRLPENWLDRSDWNAWSAPIELKPSSSALTETQWRDHLKRFQRTGSWPQTFGPRPGAAGCVAPPAILAEFQIGAVR